MAHVTQYKDGRWRAQVRKVGFRPKSKIFPTKKAAEGWAKKTETDMEHHTYRDPSKFAKDTIGQLFEKFRDEVSPNRKGARWEIVRINKLLRDAEFAARRTTDLTPGDIRSWRDERLKEVTPPSVNREMNLISKVFAHAIREWGYHWAVNPVHEVGRPAGGSGKPRKRRWSQAEIDAFLAACNFDIERQPQAGTEWAAWGLLLIIETAMRPSEFCNAKVRDLNLAKRYLRLHDSKNGDSRDVPLSTKAVQLLTKLTEGRKPEQALFGVTAGTLSCYYRTARKAAGLTDADLRLYDGKHEGISRMAPKFRDALELSKVTGHRSLKSLAVYYNPTVDELADKLG